MLSGTVAEVIRVQVLTRRLRRAVPRPTSLVIGHGRRIAAGHFAAAMLRQASRDLVLTSSGR